MAYSKFDLRDKVAVITGGNGGIGLGIAEALAEAGAAVCIWGTKAEKNALALERLRSYGTRVNALTCDVGDEDSVERSFAHTLEAFGHVDAFFANAGVIGSSTVRSFIDMESTEWRRVMRVNLDGAFYTLRAAARHMVGARRGGSLIATSSLAALSGAPCNEHYAATKGALVSLMRGLAVELARHEIRANIIQPGWFESTMTDEILQNPRFMEKVLPRVPLRRWGAPSDLGGIAIYLVSDASAYHTGDTFLIDGGYSKF